MKSGNMHLRSSGPKSGHEYIGTCCTEYGSESWTWVWARAFETCASEQALA